LQIIEEQSQRMFALCEHTDESPKHQLKAALRIRWREFSDWWLFSYDEPQFGNQIHNELPVRI
jgi:hypothetical protein